VKETNVLGTRDHKLLIRNAKVTRECESKEPRGKRKKPTVHGGLRTNCDDKNGVALGPKRGKKKEGKPWGGGAAFGGGSENQRTHPGSGGQDWGGGSLREALVGGKHGERFAWWVWTTEKIAKTKREIRDKKNPAPHSVLAIDF